MIPSPSVHQANYAKFIYFHPSTKGSAGRAVFIDPQLLVRFMELIDIQSAKGDLVARSIIGLQSTAGGTTSDSNQSCAFQHRQTIQDLVVTYTILQNGGRGAGVYITALQHGYSSDKSRPGLYKVKPDYDSRLKWSATPDQSTSMPSLIGVLGGLPAAGDGAVSTNEMASAFATGPLKGERISSGFSLFYTPTYVIDDMGVWLTSDQKLSGRAADSPKIFAQLLANTENKSQIHGAAERYKWYIVGQGAKIFQQALQEYKRLTKHPLSRSHDFYFIDPQVPLGLLQKDLRECGIDLSRDKNIIHSSMSVASQVHQLADVSRGYFNMHRPWQRDMAINSSVNEASEVFNSRNKSTVYFSDIVKKLSIALKGKW